MRFWPRRNLRDLSCVPVPVLRNCPACHAGPLRVRERPAPATRSDPIMSTVDDLLADPLRPMGLAEVASLLSPFVALSTLGAWKRRGHLPSARWTVNGADAWVAADFVPVLRSVLLHFPEDGRAFRCGSTCPACTVGDVPVSWDVHESDLGA